MTHPYLDDVDLAHPDFAPMFDEAPLWSAPFGVLLLDRVPLRRGMTILDVGTGTGFIALELAMRGGADTRVVAVDPWAAAAARLSKKIAYLDLKNVEVRVEDAATLALPDASIDLAVSNLGLNNFEDPARVMKNVARLLRPGGVFSATTNLTGHMTEFYDAFRDTLIAENRADRLPALEEHLAHRGSVDSIHALFAAAGLRPTRTEHSYYRMRFADGTAFLTHHFIRLGFMGAWKKVAGDADLPPFFAALERHLNALAASRGEFTVTIPVAYFEAIKG